MKQEAITLIKTLLNHTKDQRPSGFTLIEMLIVVSLIGLVSVTASGFLIVSLMASSKAIVMKEVRQSGNHALSVMEGLIFTSTSVGCTAPDTINVKDKDGNIASFLCQVDGKISSASAASTVNLTSSNIRVATCDFYCIVTPGLPTKVHIGYTLEKGDASLKANERASLQFETEVIPRNLD
ncbi:MAG: type II secretion system protein [Patescibacteria group bacterium]|jgi:prepilin-type N-terminal cleavage/methylation domain-containing protein